MLRTELHTRTASARRDNVPSRELIELVRLEMLLQRSNFENLNILDCDTGTSCAITIQMRK